MLNLPREIIALTAAFAPYFSEPVWQQAQVLMVGAILAPGRRTVASALRVMGLGNTQQFQNYHRVLNRASWSSRKVAQALLVLLVDTFTSTGPIILGIDETLERRRGAKIAAKGIYRDATRSSHSFFVKASGLRWVVIMLLVSVPWAKRVWALPFLTVLAPSERYHQERGLRHKKVTDWARQMILQVRRWLPERSLVFVADGGYAVLQLLWRCIHLSPAATFITRLRLDAGLYEPAPKRKPNQKGAPRKKGKRLPTLNHRLKSKATRWTSVTLTDWYGEATRTVEITSGTAVWYHSGQPVVPLRWVLIRDPKGKFEPQALLCTDQTADPVQIVTWFTLRWQLEVTFQEVRAHLGVETQRQWNDLAILRTTPALMGLFSLVTLFANAWSDQNTLPIRQASWYVKERATFSDALALVRRQLWQSMTYCMSTSKRDVHKSLRLMLDRLTEGMCYAY